MYFSSNKYRGGGLCWRSGCMDTIKHAVFFWCCYLTSCFVFTLFSISGIAGHDQFVQKTKNNLIFSEKIQKFVSNAWLMKQSGLLT